TLEQEGAGALDQPAALTRAQRRVLHGVRFPGLQRGAFVHRLHSDSNTLTAGPVKTTGPSPGHSMRSVPPGRRTLTTSSTRPRTRAAATIAHAPEPHARVSPTPRSQTRISMAS